jgi:repressor LexA
LETLEKKGHIRRDPTKPRCIEVLDETFNITRREMVQVPIVGQVAAGEPILAEENVEEYFPVPMEYMPNKQTFMLKVKGDSMINVGIFDGDLVLVEEDNTAKNGDLAVALVEDSATVKTFYKEKGHYRLQPENDDMEPIIVDDVQILGKVFGVFRFMRY